MYELGVKRAFAAAHQLKGYKGRCEALHGHTFEVEVRVRAAALDEVGLAMDFKDVKGRLDQILETYDHALLSDVPPFDKINPSSENLARTIHELVGKDLPQGVSMASVTVWESPSAWATYTADRDS